MAAQTVTAAQRSLDRREQPFLYSWNRRVRHLHGISLRNLNITPPAQKSKGRNITDDEYNLVTPAKLLANENRNSFHTSRSSSDLQKNSQPPTKAELKKAATLHSKDDAVVTRPKPGKLRRRSTLHWAGASPRVRQQKLEGVALDRMVDTWFSIHHTQREEPVYISEIMHKSMNPSFSHFDLDAATASVTRSDSFDLKVWAKNVHMDGYKLLIEMQVNLRSLLFIGKSLESFHHPLPENCVLFHLADGIYTTFTDLPAEDIHEPQLRSNQKSIAPTNSSSYDALMKLANLDDCIQDALQVRGKLEADINALLAENKQGSSEAKVELQQDRVKAIRRAVNSERKEIERLSKVRLQLKTSHDERRQAMDIATQAMAETTKTAGQYKQDIVDIRNELDNFEEMSRGQVRRICECMQVIYPIEAIKNRTLQFTIRGIHLPNSVFDDTNRDEIAAALGFTAQFVYQLSMYLSIPLPYDIETNASSSSIMDTVSLSLTQRKFPLFPTNVTYKFEYGVYLLNKNIEFLMNRVGLRVLDIRHTLPNLKYLLYVLTAGTGDIPARKVGAVKGLLPGVASPVLSRRGSEDSVQNKAGVTDHANGSVPNALARSREKSPESQDPFVGSGRVKGLPYRRSLLREAG